MTLRGICPSGSGGGSGTVTEVDTGTGLTGGPITTTGTIALANTAVVPGIYGDATHVAVINVDQQGRLIGAANQAISFPSDTGITQLTGDGTAGPGSGSQALTLATVNSNVGSFGSAAAVATFTVNGKGLITAAGSTGIAINAAAVSGLATIATSGAITDATGTLLVTHGGTALTTLTAHALYVGNGASAPTALAVGGSNTFLAGNTGADPSYRAPVLASADFVNQGTTATVLHGNAAGNPSFGAVSLTADVSGVLPLANGGTNSTDYTVASVTLTNKRINPRITTLSTSASTPTLTALGDTSDEVDMTVTSSTTTVTFGAPSGTPVNGQKLIFRVQCTNAQTYAYDSIFVGSTDVALPTAATGSSKYDLFGWIYNTTSSKWQLAAKTFGF